MSMIFWYRLWYIATQKFKKMYVVKCIDFSFTVIYTFYTKLRSYNNHKCFAIFFIQYTKNIFPCDQISSCNIILNGLTVLRQIHIIKLTNYHCKIFLAFSTFFAITSILVISLYINSCTQMIYGEVLETESLLWPIYVFHCHVLKYSFPNYTVWIPKNN